MGAERDTVEEQLGRIDEKLDLLVTLVGELIERADPEPVRRAG